MCINLYAAENVHFIVSQRHNDLFTGRENIVNKIVSSITTAKDDNSIHQPRFVLTGIGGQGKSEICRKVAAQVRDLYDAFVSLYLIYYLYI